MHITLKGNQHMYKEFTLDDSILDIDAWLPDEEVDKLANTIVEANTILDKETTIVPLLYYQKSISDQLKDIYEPFNDRVIVDCALVSGLNEYRFLLATITNGYVADTTYLEPSEELITRANQELTKYPKYVKHSVLSNAQVDSILKNN
jgi:hypothetical protein